MKPINFRFFTNLKFGEGSSRELGQTLVDNGFHRSGLIIDSGVIGTEHVKDLIASVEGACNHVRLFENKVAEPDYDYLDASKAEFIDEDLDCIVAVGGGSTMDLAKGIATLVTNPGPALDYKGFPALKNKPLPVVAVPTTAGSGSDATFNAVFTDSHARKRLGINSFDNFPTMAVLDPLLTISCPRSVTVSSGMDALTHTLEAWVAKNANTVTRTFSYQAFPLVYNGLNRVMEDPGDIETRGDLLLGAYLAGTGLMQAGAGPSGALSYPLGVHFKVPHGLGGAITLAKVVEYNVDNGYTGYTKLYDSLDGVDNSPGDDEKNKKFSEMITTLSRKLDIPSLKDVGVKPEDVDLLVEELFTTLKGAVDQNPVGITEEDMKGILISLL